MAQVVIPYSNKSNQHVQVEAGTGTTVTRTGNGSAGNPFIYTISVPDNTSKLAQANLSASKTNASQINTLDGKIRNLQKVSHRQASEKYCFYIDLSVSGTGHTLSQTVLESITSSGLTGYKVPTIASNNTAVGVNNQYNVTAFQTTAHGKYNVTAYVANRTDTSNFSQELNQYNIECFAKGSNSFSFRIVGDQDGLRGIPLANNQLEGLSLRIYIEIEGTK